MKFCFWIQLVVLLVGVNIWAADSWVAYDKLIASDGASNDYFGCSVAISGNFAVVGAYGDDDGDSLSGSAYVFDFNGTSWSQQKKLIADDDMKWAAFGQSVAISGDYIIAGAWKDDNENGIDSGSAYVFDFNGISWSQQQKLIASNEAGADFFGCSVSIDGNYLVVGAKNDNNATGCGYVFNFDDTTWTQQAKLTASDGAGSDAFGCSVSIDGNYAIVGAENSNNNAGSAYIFRRDGEVWIEQIQLMVSEGALNDYFGSAVSIDGNSVVIGAYGEDVNGVDSGSAYIFDFNGVSWSQQAKLVASDTTADDCFGWSVSIDGDYAIVGSKPVSEGLDESGFVYIFKRDGIAWPLQAKLVCPDAEKNDIFAQSVCIDGNRIVSGACGAYEEAGSAYIYELELPYLAADLTRDGFVDMDDFAIFSQQWMTGN